jgi:hypothetical protein
VSQNVKIAIERRIRAKSTRIVTLPKRHARYRLRPVGSVIRDGEHVIVFPLISGEDYPSAALRFYADAKSLYRRRRFENAAYLSGYVVECSLKTLIVLSGGLSRDHLSPGLTLLAAKAVSSITNGTRYQIVFPPQSMVQPANSWRVAMRYDPDGTVTQNTASSWLREAREAYLTSIARMRVDGLL